MICSFSKEFSKNATTNVENSFITQYLPSAGDNAVKVYLYGLYLCNHPEKEFDLKEFAEALSLSEEIVKDCFSYWEEFGLCSILSNEPFTISYLPISTISSKPRKYKAEKYSDFTKGLQVLLPSRMISTSEYTEYFNIMETYSIKPEAMLMIVQYCVDRKGADIGYHYISKVAKDFGNREINTAEKVEKELSSYLLRTSEIAKILKAMSIKRQPDIEDLNLFKKWTNELNFEPENILFVAGKLKKANVNKLDELLHKLYSAKCFSKQEIQNYLDNAEKIYNLTISINKALGVYVEVLEPEIESFISKWISCGFTQETLLYIANNLFIEGKNTLAEMNDFIDYLRNRGFIDLSSVNDYFEEQKRTDEFIKKLLLTIGANRRPTPWDRENYAMWKSWNFTEEMILEAGKISSGKSSPIAYMNGILSNWKNNSIFTPESIGVKAPSNQATNSQEEYNREYERRRNLAVSRAQKNTEKAMEIEGVKQILSRLNSLEKDLAFAEISGDQDKLINLENEQKRLTLEVESLLKTKKLSLKDLSPVYACDKCNDTGYVGTHRCDCFNNKFN